MELNADGVDISMLSASLRGIAGGMAMGITITPDAMKIIDEYMGITPEARRIIDKCKEDSGEPEFYGLERSCTPELEEITRQIFQKKCVRMPFRLKGEPYRETEWDLKYDCYYGGSLFLGFMPIHYHRRRDGYKFLLTEKCRMYFEENSKSIAEKYIQMRWGTAENAVEHTNSFLGLCADFAKWFNERRDGFLKEMDAAIAEIKKFQMSEKPQSHGGVANLLKVLTKTMEKQGADITNIAKVQYAICIQAGIYIPDEFVQDVAVAMNILEDNEERRCEDGRKE